MNIETAKEILAQFDRLKLEITEGLNLLSEQGLISDNAVELRDVADADAVKCAAWLKAHVPHHPPFHTPATMSQFQ